MRKGILIGLGVAAAGYAGYRMLAAYQHHQHLLETDQEAFDEATRVGRRVRQAVSHDGMSVPIRSGPQVEQSAAEFAREVSRKAEDAARSLGRNVEDAGTGLRRGLEDLVD